ncbi:MAG TPA: imidazole glycerol phosphate synthase subunit HisH, partial [Turneriella sp.]|nr:imidazole glycerol phosphate synthase subunit HisH [Turneriella sp.]
MHKSQARIALIDFGMGNIRSLQKAFEFLGHAAVVTGDYKEAQKADVLLLPGDGAFARAMHGLKEQHLDEVLYEAH